MNHKPFISPPLELQKFQQTYAKFLRDPHHNKRPNGVPFRQSRVYEDLLFNNLCGFINKCFPVSKSIFKEDVWRRLCRVFFRDWSSTTPYFIEIPKEFVDYLHSDKAPNFTPRWLAELAHYEWIELYVETHPATVPSDDKTNPTIGSATNAQKASHQILTSNPTLQILQYEWPVQKISTNFRPTIKELTHLLVYRTGNHQVKFMTTNMVTAAMLELIEETPATIDVTIASLSRLLNDADQTQLKQFAEPIIDNLLALQVLTR